ncbi:MAG TPA: glycoside hydrolase family 3 N-terminal domain-containing protein [Opitutaceae bacterium]|jgi:beta-glucosidase|nr:glycoside hydrolase family 3 N-terminal domain-containing protein [Opitutaceae bacterium]
MLRRCLFGLLLPLAARCLPAAPAPYQDASRPIDIRIQDLMSRMTLDEKVAQLQGKMIRDPKAFDAQGNFIGGPEAPELWQGAGSVWAGLEQAPGDLHAVARINASLEKFMRERTRLGIPVFTFAESLHGYMAAGATSFPQAIALGSTWDPALVERVFTVAAREASAAGVRQVLSPVLDLARDPRWGRFEECYSEDPYLVSRIGLAAVRGLQGRGATIDPWHVEVTLKHFAGHGQPEGGRNIAPVDIGERMFRTNHLYPFQVAVEVGHAHSVMASYNEIDGVPNHANPWLLQTVLRGEWGFQGYVMSDGGGIDTLYQNQLAAAGPAEAGVLAIKAGVDYDLGGKGRCYSTLADEVRHGLVPMAAIDRAVAGVLRVKFLCGMFDRPYADVSRVDTDIKTPAHVALARQAADEAMILLKNEGHVLPLDPARLKTLAVIGPNASDVHLGGYSYVPMAGVSVLQGIKDYAAGRFAVRYAEGCKLTANHASGWMVNENPILNDRDEDSRLIDEAVAVALHSDAVVLVLGENELLRREAWEVTHLGDRDTLQLVGRQHELARAILATGKPVVVLLINGGPLAITYLQDHAPAIIEGWYLGNETGHAVADVLFGKVSPSGKLTVTFPRSVGQLPDYYDRQPSRFRDYVLADSTPLYPFGFGLSYAQFDYHNLRIAPAEIAADGTAQVSVDVTNHGRMRADEIVQLYIHDRVSLPVRPVQELKGFQRITLDPGETRTVRFTLGPDELAAYDLKMRRRVQPGSDFEVMVGRSSADYLKGRLQVGSGEDDAK